MFAGAAQHGAHAGEQFARVERLGQIIVRAQLQPGDPVGLLAHRGQHDDRHRGLAAQPAGEIGAAFAGEHEVKHDEVELALRPQSAALAGVLRGGDAEALALEEAGEQVTDFAVIVDDEQAGIYSRAGGMGEGGF